MRGVNPFLLLPHLGLRHHTMILIWTSTWVKLWWTSARSKVTQSLHHQWVRAISIWETESPARKPIYSETQSIQFKNGIRNEELHKSWVVRKVRSSHTTWWRNLYIQEIGCLTRSELSPSVAGTKSALRFKILI